jgi:hypothetical protein
VDVVVGGPAAEAMKAVLEGEGVEVFSSLEEFRMALRARGAGVRI